MIRRGHRLELDTKEALGLVCDIKKEFSNTVLVLSGGEPLLRKDLFEILSCAFSVGLKTALATNGTLLGEREAAKFKELDVKRVSISLDSVEQRHHDTSRGIDGSFKKALSSSAILKKHNIPFQINFTITKTNSNEIHSVADLALSMGAEAVHYFVLVPVGCGMEISQNQMLDARDMDKVLLKIKSLSEEMLIEIKPTCAPQYVRFVKEGVSSGCLAGSRVFFISSEGDIYPCGYLPARAGSLREEYIADIWENSLVFKELRQNNLKGGCSFCSYKNICRGCRARSYSLTGDYMDEDPLCSIADSAAAPCSRNPSGSSSFAEFTLSEASVLEYRAQGRSLYDVSRPKSSDRVFETPESSKLRDFRGGWQK